MIIDKRPVVGRLLKRMRHFDRSRNMQLMYVSSRCVRAGEIHELVTTDEPSSCHGATVGPIGFVGFVEITKSGVLEIGDEVRANGNAIGCVVGFDECHFPNHYNIVVGCEKLWTAESLGLKVDDDIAFAQQERNT